MVTYEIRIDGTLPPELIQNMTGVSAVQSAGTLMEVNVPDETALWGLIDALRDAGIDMLEVRRRRADEPPTADH
jgi:hypothetical protein